MALYTPTVEKITKKDGQRIVTVGYVPTSSNNATGELSLTAPTEPTKYMDYVFTRGENRQWYLTALRDSDMQVEVTPIPPRRMPLWITCRTRKWARRMPQAPSPRPSPRKALRSPRMPKTSTIPATPRQRGKP